MKSYHDCLRIIVKEVIDLEQANPDGHVVYVVGKATFVFTFECALLLEIRKDTMAFAVIIPPIQM